MSVRMFAQRLVTHPPLTLPLEGGEDEYSSPSRGGQVGMGIAESTF
jgi:hypothetical protein